MADVVESLIADAYGSLTGPDQHAAFMRSLAKAFRSHVIAYQVDRPGHLQSVSAHYDHQGRDLGELGTAASKQPYVNPWFASSQVMRLFREGIADEQGCIEPSALRATDFYTDILRPFDIFHSAGFLLEQGDGASVMTISRSLRRGCYLAYELELGKKLLPHLRNIHAIQKVFAEQPITDGTVCRPAFLLTVAGSICGMNSQARDLLAESQPFVGIRHGQLWVAHSQDRLAFQDALDEVVAGARLAARVPIRDSSHSLRYIAHISHCRREAFMTWLLTGAPAVLVVVQGLHSEHADLAPSLKQLYGLTSAECRVADALLEADSLRAVAASLCRSEETVRSQLKSIYAKTGVHSQAALLKLLCALTMR